MCRRFHPSFENVEARGSFAEPGSAFRPSPAKDAPSVGRGHSLQPSVFPLPLQCVGLKRSFHRPKRFTYCTWCFDHPRFHGFFPPRGAFLLVLRNHLWRFSLQPSFEARAPMRWMYVSVHVVQIHSVVSQPHHRCLSFVSAACSVRPNQRHVGVQDLSCFCCVRSRPTTRQHPRGGDASPPRRHRHGVPATTLVQALSLPAYQEFFIPPLSNPTSLVLFCVCLVCVEIHNGHSLSTWKPCLGILPRSLLSPFQRDREHQTHANGCVGCDCGSLRLRSEPVASFHSKPIPCSKILIACSSSKPIRCRRHAVKRDQMWMTFLGVDLAMI